MTRRLFGLVCLTLVGGMAARTHADEGMWLLNSPPTKLLAERYNFAPTPAWLEHVQKSCVRMDASGSFVSPAGLLMTNHHVASDQLAKLSTAERNLLEDGFLAGSMEEEIRCKDMEVQVLQSIEDVTQRVLEAGAKLPAGEAAAARRKRMAEIEAEAREKTGLDAEVVTLYQGARYHLYSYRRYDDVRLVFAPEMSVAFFGGDNDNFEYPRYCLDVTFLRVYDNGQPLKTEHYLSWSRKGIADGELALVAGHPARTRRLLTVDHTKFVRDVDLPWTMRTLARREVQAIAFANRSAEHARIIKDELFGVQNSRKAFTGGQQGLLDARVFNKKIETEKKLLGYVTSDAGRADEYGQAWPEIAEAQRIYKEMYLPYQALEGRRGLRGALVGIARTLVRLADELPKPSGERLREFRESEMESVYLDLYSEAPIYPLLETDRLAAGLTQLAEALGADHPLVIAALAGVSPPERAAQLVAGTKLADVAVRRQLAEGGKSAIVASKDPLIQLISQLDPEARKLRKRYEEEVEAVERAAYQKVAAARFALFGESEYPDATGTLRLSFGPVRGYKEGETTIPPFTKLGGIFERSEQRGGQAPFALPARWKERRQRLALDTPFNFVCTPDIIGGNSGSPVINREGEVVGLIFDGNIHSLVWDFAYDDQQGRAVAVDARAILETLRNVYDANALVGELLGEAKQ